MAGCIDLEVGSHQSHISHSSEDFDYYDDDDGTYSEIPEPAVGMEMYRSANNGLELLKKCKVIYSYEKSTDAALSIHEGEVLDVIETEDENNDGWTKVRRNLDDIIEEGYVPTSYIKSILDYPSSGSHSPVPPQQPIPTSSPPVT